MFNRIERISVRWYNVVWAAYALCFCRKDKNMMYDALYGRQSIEKKDSISVESQLEYCRYETHGDPYIEYADRGFSGKNTNRPDFERMMNDIRAGKD